VAPRRGRTCPTGADERDESVKVVDGVAAGAPSSGGGVVNLGRSPSTLGPQDMHAWLTRAYADEAPVDTIERAWRTLPMRRL
jgi:hypothetical protein